MAEMDFSSLRPVLDECEQFATAISPTDPRFDIAKQMLSIVAGARDSLHPSADSTANFVQSRDVIEQLAMLRATADSLRKD